MKTITQLLDRNQKTLLLASMLILCYFSIFYNLDKIVIQLWDESRLACNAQEMLQNKNYILTYYDGEPDMWNTKPPLMIWLQVLFMKILGVGELAVRLPSAIAALLSCILLYVLSSKINSRFWSIAPILVLLSTHGYIRLHGTRTGDYDALLSLFSLLAYLSFYWYYRYRKPKYLYAFFIFLALGVLTKGITILLFLPGLGLFLLIKKQLKHLFSSPHFYVGILIFSMVVLSYYLSRENMNPGYLNAVYANEIGGRYGQAQHELDSPISYYFDLMLDSQFLPWFLLLPLTFFWGLGHSENKIRNFYTYILLLCTCFFIIISTAQTKFDWYDLPLFPLFALCTGIFLDSFLQSLKLKSPMHPVIKSSVWIMILYFLAFYFPYQQLTYYSRFPEKIVRHEEDEVLENILQQGLKGERDLNNYKVLVTKYNAQNRFYIEALQSEQVNISYADSAEALVPGNRVWAYLDKDKRSIISKFNIKTLEEESSLVCFEILSRKVSHKIE